MRIVGGEYRGKKLALPDDNRIRPTSERAREALFNILAHGDDYRTDAGPLPRDARVLDAFAGTGSLGMEALSRGAAHVTFMDNHYGSLKLVRENIDSIDARSKVDIMNRNCTLPGKAGQAADLVLIDPPYSGNLSGTCLQALDQGGWLKESTIVVIELAAKEPFELLDGFEMLDNRKYGAAQLVFLRKT